MVSEVVLPLAVHICGYVLWLINEQTNVGLWKIHCYMIRSVQTICGLDISSMTSVMKSPWTTRARWSSTFNSADAKSQKLNVSWKREKTKQNKLRTSRNKDKQWSKHFLNVFKLLVLKKNAFAFIIIFCHASETKQWLLFVDETM